MNLNDYQHLALQTAVYSEEHVIIYPALGLSNEVGEVLGKTFGNNGRACS